MYQGRRIQIYITENTSVIIHILILHPGSVAELMNLHRQKVSLSILSQIFCNIKAVGAVAVLAVSHLFAVHINIISRFHSLEGNINPPSRPLQAGVYVKTFSVQAHRIIIYRRLRAGHIGIIFTLPRHLDIRINGKIKSLARPAAWKLQV